jgi:hypothetical protein
MKFKVIHILLLTLLPTCIYAGPKNVVECGKEWINIHKNNKDLIGVYVQQYPDGIPEHKYYEGKHPNMIIYVFKGGKIHTVTYTPSGQVQNGGWNTVKKDHWVYKQMSKDLNLKKTCEHWYKKK